MVHREARLLFDDIKGCDPAALRSADESTIAGWCETLRSKDAKVRARAAFMLAMLPEHPSDLSKRLIRQIKKDRDEHAKASLVLALGVSELRSQSVERVALLERLTGCDSESPRVPPLCVRLAAILALTWVKPFDASQEMIELLRENADMALSAEAMPWNAGDLGGLIRPALSSLEDIDIDEAMAEMEALMKAHAHTRNEGWAVEVDWAWRRLTQRMFTPLGEWREGTPVLSELSDAQRHALSFALDNRLSWLLTRHGIDFIMPKWDRSWPSIHRYLGRHDPGPLDWQIESDHRGESKRHPIWKWFRLLACDEVDEHTLKGALTDALSPAEIVDLARDASFMVYATRDEGDDDPSPRSTLLRDLIEEHGAEVDAADVDAIRFTLDMIGKGDMWKMEDEGWEGGPYESTTKKDWS